MTSLNPLAPVTDYQSMVNRIFWFTSASALVAAWMLRLHNPVLSGLLSQIDFHVEFSGDKTLPIPGGYLFRDFDNLRPSVGHRFVFSFKGDPENEALVEEFFRLDRAFLKPLNFILVERR